MGGGGHAKSLCNKEMGISLSVTNRYIGGGWVKMKICPNDPYYS